jgi:hypothetical protein
MSKYTKDMLDYIASHALLINYIDVSNILNKIKQLYVDRIVIRTFETLEDITIEQIIDVYPPNVMRETYDELALTDKIDKLYNISEIFGSKSREDILKFIYYHCNYTNRDKTLFGFMLNLHNANTIIIDAFRHKNHHILNMIFELINIKNKIINDLHDDDFNTPLQLLSFLDSELDVMRVISTTYNVFFSKYANIINTYWTGPFIIIDDIIPRLYMILYDHATLNEYEFLYIPFNTLIKKEEIVKKPIMYIYHKKIDLIEKSFNSWFRTWKYNIIQSFITSIKTNINTYIVPNGMSSIEKIKNVINYMLLTGHIKIRPDDNMYGIVIISKFLTDDTIRLIISLLSEEDTLRTYLSNNLEFKSMIYDLYKLTYDYFRYTFNHNGQDYIFLEEMESPTMGIHFIHGNQQFDEITKTLSYNNIGNLIYSIIEYDDSGILDDYSLFNSINFQSFYNKPDFMIGGKYLRKYTKYNLKLKQFLNV